MRVVIPSVKYADFLADTLPAWKAAVPHNARIVVVTSPEDLATQRVAASHHVRTCITDQWTQNQAKFNKGGALDLAFGFSGDWTAPPTVRETCISIDADVYPVGRLPERDTLRSWQLYGCARHGCTDREDFLVFRSGGSRVEEFPIVLQRRKGEPGLGDADDRHRAARACLGYFQLFRYQPGICFGSSVTAGKYDMEFRRHFQARLALDGFAVLHLGPLNRQNWRGRVIRPWQELPA